MPIVRDWYLDEDRIPTTTKRYNEVKSESLDLTNELGSETISSHTWDSSGPTISGSVAAGAVISWKVTGAGYGTLKVVTSGARTLHYPMHWRSTDQEPLDYA
jgi:hypothetical protein